MSNYRSQHITINDNPSIENVMDFIASSSIYGNLGLFIGAGFSKAFVNNEASSVPLSWENLLKEVATKLNIISDDLFSKAGMSFPEIASQLCIRHAKENSCELNLSIKKFKRKIAALTNWLPEEKTRKKLNVLMEKISPSWIITTNYDFVLESILVDKGIQLSPKNTFLAPKGYIPIYHLHGHRLEPDSIVITQEDYVELFRPNQYRQTKLPLHIKESTVVTLGYGIGDSNVLTAIDWSKNVYDEYQNTIPTDFIQIIRKGSPASKPYRAPLTNILILEVTSLEDFLSELNSRIDSIQDEHNKKVENRKKLSEALCDPKKTIINDFIDDREFRESFISKFEESDLIAVSSFIQFLSKCIDETWKRAEPRGEFEAYNKNLNIILDILTKLKINNIHPVLFDYIIDSLDRVAPYIGEDSGQSWSANKSWKSRNGDIPKTTIREIKNHAQNNGKYSLSKLLKDLT